MVSCTFDLLLSDKSRSKVEGSTRLGYTTLSGGL
jgi:hypothetical protein